jgi:hypothetical protein
MKGVGNMEKGTLAERLLLVQSKLKAPKNQYNGFGKYHYRNCEDILEALKPLLSEEGLLLKVSDEVVQVGERYYIKATVKISGNDYMDFIEASAYAREEENKKGMDGAQVTGAASSYARKYALNGLFLIDDTKDADTPQGEQNAEKTPKNVQTAPQQTTRQQIITKCIEFAHKLNFDADEMAQYLEKATDAEVRARYDLLKKQIG